MKNRNLYELLFNDPAANDYFWGLPNGVRDNIGAQASDINTFSDLMDHADKLAGGTG